MAPFGFEAKSAKDLGLPEPDETGTTFEENAYIKAWPRPRPPACRRFRTISGLVVDALGGDPGVYTANWAEKPDGGRDFMMAMQKTEDLLQARGATAAGGAEGPLRRRASALPGRTAARSISAARWKARSSGRRAATRASATTRFSCRTVMSETFGEMNARRSTAGSPARPTRLSHRARAFQKFARATLGAAMNAVRRRTPGFGVYVHWPFCAAKCPYCDFNRHVRHQPVDQERFAAAFATEIAAMRARTGAADGHQHLPRRRHAIADGA